MKTVVCLVRKCDGMYLVDPSKPPSVEALLGAVTLSNLARRWKDEMTMLFSLIPVLAVSLPRNYEQSLRTNVYCTNILTDSLTAFVVTR